MGYDTRYHQPKKNHAPIPTIIISRSTNADTTLPKPAQENFQGADDDDGDDDDVNFGDLSTVDEILSASVTVPDKEIPALSGLEV